MEKNIRFQLILLIIVIMVSGCASGRNPSRSEQMIKTVDNTVPAEQSSYYHYTKSELLKQKGDFDKAIISLKKAIKDDPGSVFLKKELISLYLYKHDREKALEISQELVDQDPDNTDNLMILAKLNQMLHREDDAMNLYHKILQLNPDNKNIYLILGRLYMEKKDIDDAFRLYSKMVRHFPDSYTAHFFLGKIHALKKNPDYAEKEFLKTLKLNPDLVTPRFELIKIYKAEATDKSGIDTRVISLYKKILDIEPSNMRAKLELPLYYYNNGHKDKALKMFTAAGKKLGGSNMFLSNAAREFINSKRYKDASIVFTGLLRGAPENSLLHYFAGIAFDALKQTKKAIKNFLQIRQNSAFYKMSVIHLAFLYNEYGNRGKAIKLLEKKNAQFPEDIDIITYLSSFYEENKVFDKAMKTLAKGIDISPDNTQLIFRLGVVQDKAGEKKKCIETMKKVIKLDPNNSSALNYLGYTYAEMGTNLDRAEELIIRALKLKPDDGFITDSLGWVYFKKGLYKKAEKILVKAVHLSSFDPVICEHLGDVYKKTEQYKKAIDIYKKALLKSKKNKSDLKKKIMELEKREKKTDE